MVVMLLLRLRLPVATAADAGLSRKQGGAVEETLLFLIVIVVVQRLVCPRGGGRAVGAERLGPREEGDGEGGLWARVNSHFIGCAKE